MQGKQTALGEEFCVVGIEAYAPKTMSLNRFERGLVSRGDFTPLSERELRVIEALRLRNGQSLLFDGQSLAGDLAVQTAHDMLFDKNKGIAEVTGLSPTECARTKKRGFFRMTGAMALSGGRLQENIMDSDVPALLEAWGVAPTDRGDEKAIKKAVNAKVNSDVLAYMLGDVASHVAMTRGFATDASVQQLIRIFKESDLPVMVTRSHDSRVFAESGMKELREHSRPGVELWTNHDNDHSADDNVRASAARILYFARLATAQAS